MSLQYIHDHTGATTAVIIPIQDWEHIINTHADLRSLEKAEKQSLQKLSSFAGTLSKNTAAKFNRYLDETNKEWEMRFPSL